MLEPEDLRKIIDALFMFAEQKVPNNVYKPFIQTALQMINIQLDQNGIDNFIQFMRDHGCEDLFAVP